MIKLLGIDLDGTCLNSKNQLSSKTRETLIKAIEQGVIVVPVTGRALSIVPEDVLEIPGLEYIITSSGAIIQDLKTGEILYSQIIPKKQLEEAMEILNEYDCLMLEAYINGVNYVSQETLDYIGEFISNEAYWDLFLKDMDPIPLEELKERIGQEPVEKMNFRTTLNNSEKFEEIFNRLKKIKGLDFVHAEGNGEFTSKEANKGEALAALAKRLGIDRSEVMAIGDSNNDLSMLTFAQTGVAMGQAQESVKSAANYITCSNDEEGVAEAVHTLILDTKSSRASEGTDQNYSPDENTVGG